MSKNNEGAHGSTTLVTTLATTGGLMVLRKVLAAGWTKGHRQEAADGPDRSERDAAGGARLGRRHRVGA